MEIGNPVLFCFHESRSASSLLLLSAWSSFPGGCVPGTDKALVGKGYRGTIRQGDAKRRHRVLASGFSGARRRRLAARFSRNQATRTDDLVSTRRAGADRFRASSGGKQFLFRHSPSVNWGTQWLIWSSSLKMAAMDSRSPRITSVHCYDCVAGPPRLKRAVFCSAITLNLTTAPL